MNTTIKADSDTVAKTSALRSTAKKSTRKMRKQEDAVTPAELSKRIGWLRRKAKLYIGKTDP